MTSQPAYDPNDFATGIDRGTWAKLNTDPLLPLQDRLIQGTYQPGSTFKVVDHDRRAERGPHHAGLQGHLPGLRDVLRPHVPVRQARGARHARPAPRDRSSRATCTSTPSAACSRSITIHEYAEKLGLTGKTGIDLPNESESLVPSTEWKMRTTGEKWYPGETISVAIGQGQVTVTPIALATMITTVANGGTVVMPHVVRAVDDGTGWRMLEPPQPRSVFQFRPDVLQVLRDGLWNAVNGTGTAGRARIEGRDVAGKTGTAQVISKEGEGGGVRQGPGPARQQLVRILRARRQRRDLRRRLRRARRLRRRIGGAHREVHADDVLREEGRPAAADARVGGNRPCRKPPVDAPRRPRPRPIGRSRGDRRPPAAPASRLAAHRGRARPDVHRSGDDLQRHVGFPDAPAGRRVLDAGLRAADWPRRG